MHDAIPSMILNEWLQLEEDLFHLQVLSYLPPQILICFSILYSNYTIKLVNNSTAALDYIRKVRTIFCPDFLTELFKGFQFCHCG